MPISEVGSPPYHASDQLVRMNVEEYLKLAESGVLREGSSIELLDGVLVWKDRRDHEGSIMVVGTRHSTTVTRLFQLLSRLTEGRGCFAASQQPIQLSENSMPEPDVMLLSGAVEDFADRHPTPAQALLVVEVADSSLRQDREGKLPMYAAAGVPEFWIVNLVDKQVEVHRQPDVGSASYAEVLTTHPGESLELQLHEKCRLSVKVSDFLS